MKVIVSGGAGFIGSPVTNYLLLQRHQVIVVNNLLTDQACIPLHPDLKFLHQDGVMAQGLGRDDREAVLLEGRKN